jgi:ribosomal protein S18 acetylase RimI-like enzyme
VFCDVLRKDNSPHVYVEKITQIKPSDLSDLCDATEKTIEDSVLSFSTGSAWVKSPTRERLEQYWKGLLLIPERAVFVGRLDGVIASAIQVIKPAANSQTQNFAGTIRDHFVAPWARGYGLAKMLIASAEEEAKASGLKILKLEVRATQEAAITMYENAGFKKWGELDKYEMLDGKFVSGYFYYKDIE